MTWHKLLRLILAIIIGIFILGVIRGGVIMYEENSSLPDPDTPWFSMPTEGEFSHDPDEGTPYDVGYNVDGTE